MKTNFWIYNAENKILGGPYITQKEAEESMRFWADAHHIGTYDKEFPADFDL